MSRGLASVILCTFRFSVDPLDVPLQLVFYEAAARRGGFSLTNGPGASSGGREGERDGRHGGETGQ